MNINDQWIHEISRLYQNHSGEKIKKPFVHVIYIFIFMQYKKYNLIIIFFKNPIKYGTITILFSNMKNILNKVL